MTEEAELQCTHTITPEQAPVEIVPWWDGMGKETRRSPDVQLLQVTLTALCPLPMRTKQRCTDIALCIAGSLVAPEPTPTMALLAG